MMSSTSQCGNFTQIMGSLTAGSYRIPPVLQQTEPINLGDLEDIIREELRRSCGNSTATSDLSQPSVASWATQSLRRRRLKPSLETAPGPDSARGTTQGLSYFREAVAPNVLISPMSPVTLIAPFACAGADMTPYPSTKPYQEQVQESVRHKSKLTSSTDASTRSATRQASKDPHVKTSKKPGNRRSELFAPVASTSNRSVGTSDVPQDSCRPKVVIYEQPQPKRRFRYDSEIHSAGAIHGVNSRKGHKSYPKIKIEGACIGLAVITVSLVSETKPYRVHPNGIVGKKKFTHKDFSYIYVKRVPITGKDCVIEFNDLGIRLVKPKQIKEALQLREAQGVDPFRQGYTFLPESVDLQKVRLCFQVKLDSQQCELEPVVSDVIHHSKMLSSLNIRMMCECRASKNGGTNIMFLCKEVYKEDLEVVFFEEENHNLVWEKCVRIFEAYDRSVIVCAAPAYRDDVPLDKEVTVSVALRRPSDGECGVARHITYAADMTDVCLKKKKVLNNRIKQYIKEKWTPPATLPPDFGSQDDQEWRKKPWLLDFDSAMPGPSAVSPALSEPNYVTPALSGPNYSINAFMPGINQFLHMQTKIPSSPDMDPMSPELMVTSDSKDDNVLSPEDYLDTDGSIPDIDTIVADACKLLDF